MPARLQYRTRAKPDVLTPMQLVCGRLVCMGLMQKEISSELKITPKTVNKHLEQVNRKLKTRSPIQTVRAMLLLDLIGWDEFLQPNIEEWREARRVSYP